jgi:hypothetical protein
MPQQFLHGSEVAATLQDVRREGMAQRVRRRRFVEAEGAAELLHRPLDDARLQRPAARTDEKRTVRRDRMGALTQVVGDPGGDHRQHRHDTLLVALAGDANRIALRPRCVAPLQRQRLGNAQPRAVEQSEDRGIACRDPRFLVERVLHCHDTPCRIDRQRPRQAALRPWRTDGAERCTVGAALALEEPDQRADPGDAPRQRARAGAVVPPCRHEGADVGGGKLAEFRQPRRAAKVAGQEAEEVLGVAAVGLDRLRREAALAGQMLAPALHRLGEVGRGDHQRSFGVGDSHRSRIFAAG